MSMLARRTAFRALRTPVARPALRRTYADSTAEAAGEKKDVLSKGAKRDPELYILLTIMTGAFTLAGWHFSRNPTSSSSENKVAQVEHSEPWKTGSDARYQYHPGGDPSRGKRDAPSALNEVIIPNVNLPKELHEKYNKWGKEGF
ncbi:unnamed protein product [Zymoseptoria tritici ST99CH_1A5]|uniref:Uncharacterized protein n=4 Tax=Zymoseptoria tritici TaxID=1047171 RepID=F9XQ61_ZYMTI|nr:uncharacterized protein MYCGRDRAFT_64677 [Zymoseptoria tritici IPO323]EGP82582.1 hypothetical protein MYCGRDRAFT_64677 [Zymoseptoria tritici IPO323]SMQ56219.1 unnamed protein product [Zymoseptoria tritici ST99CH_3D7]SMR62061.1 unnamed protein product [Zymoseptoria tritici ST99CH_1E4]SMY29894.1 unnamed protein product [Zymoseptoria tritici ST99CH_1A5]